MSGYTCPHCGMYDTVPLAEHRCLPRPPAPPPDARALARVAEAPERVWLWHDHGADRRRWAPFPDAYPSTPSVGEYIRADLHRAALAAARGEVDAEIRRRVEAIPIPPHLRDRPHGVEFIVVGGLTVSRQDLIRALGADAKGGAG